MNETDTELDHEDAYRFRSIAARLNFIAADRVDIQFASKAPPSWSALAASLRRISRASAP